LAKDGANSLAMTSTGKKIFFMVCSQTRTSARQDWLDQMPELGIIADVEPVFVFRKSTADITPDVWLKLATEINSRQNKGDGFVVLHGTDNLLSTSAAISFLLQNFNKPIIFTGAQSETGRSNKLEARANLINACQVATYHLPEVCIIYGNRILRANQTTGSDDIFTAPETGVLGRIDFSVRIFEKLVLRKKGEKKFQSKLNTNIELINLQPALNYQTVAQSLPAREGIIINAGEYENLPEELLALCGRVSSNVPIVIWSKKIASPIVGPKNIILINNLTWETTATKFMWALAAGRTPAKVKELMTKDAAGETLT